MKSTVTILGAGESGTGAALLAKQKGYAPFVSSLNKIARSYKNELIRNHIDFEEGKHTLERIIDSSFIIKSPGVPNDIPILKRARKEHVEIMGEVAFSLRYLPGRLIAISGTNGKTTTARLTYSLMHYAGLDVVLAGNIGPSLSRTLLDPPHVWYVVEMSSFQLEDIENLNADIAALLNITPDHLDRHDYQLDKYVEAKMRLVAHSTSKTRFIYHANDPEIIRGLKDTPCNAKRMTVSLIPKKGASAFSDNEEMHFRGFSTPLTINQSNTELRGPHNRINIMVAVLAAQQAGAPISCIKPVVTTFKGAPHCMERVATIKGVEVINDSKATNVEATRYALESCPAPLIWIAGGVDKGNDYSRIRTQVRQKVKMMLCLGRDNEKLKYYFRRAVALIEEADDMAKLVEIALREAERGDTVLLSPACASFNLFSNYADRGNRFKAAVLQWIKKNRPRRQL